MTRRFRTPPTVITTGLGHYVIATAATVIAALLGRLLDPTLAREVPFVTFYAAITVSAWLGGTGPGVLATLLSALVGVSAWAARGVALDVVTPLHVAELAVFLATGVVISGLTGRLTGARARAERLTQELQAEIADHRRAEDARRELEAQREALLAREQAARAQAEAASRAKDEFLATVSHELRSPLHAILGWVQLLRAGQRDEPTVTRAVMAIERSAKVQAQLVGDLLDTARAAMGGLRIDMRPVDLGPVIAAALDVVRPAAEAKGVRLETTLDPAAGPVMGDPARLQQVLWNLLSNAVKFTPRAGRVAIRLHRTGSRAEIVVTDTGHGIDATLLPHVFDRFRQADGPTPPEQRGLGLGLAIVRDLVERHGGTVQAASAGAAQGATFTVRLPITPVRLPVVSSAAADRALPALADLRVLIVDDEADARQLLAAVLEARGARVTTAACADDALDALEGWRPDVLVSDLGMPREDGYAMIRRIRGRPLERGGGVPAVALTGHASAADRARALLAGFQMHVPKPVDAGELVVVVAALGGRAPGPEPSAARQ